MGSFIEHGGSFINMGRFTFSIFVFYNFFYQFIILTSFLCFRNKDKLIKLEVFLQIFIKKKQ